ncbi:ParB/Srx family N-terminal domain-containing protein [Pectobacterium cacticida]|uniref:ParB/Srx family N-terminal domain-containing protein n=1 Tax=Pectobacterium cacticida TaxID=69221 RepID=A0ABZ2GAK0_9GAMM|nr:ParB/Srx family N-terminal domain-containing protein [Pectobacterium cacticida]UYX06744.1 ParB/Srx family N-terminal domain-containing protein [Pectobacterium cacticida]
MKRTLILLGLLLSVEQALAALPADLGAGQSIKVEISQLHPTQAAIGYRQLDYKLNRYKADPKKLFDDYCESAGQKGVKTYNAQSRIDLTSSFTCKATVGSDPGAMKTAVIAPDNNLYLTDGHHTFTNFAALAGLNTQVYVRITDDFRDQKSMDAFWDKMKEEHLVWLGTPKGEIQPDALPRELGRNHMINDEYRSLVYFARGIGFTKRSNSPPFLEFYWGKWLATQISFSASDLNNRHNYADAVEKVASKMTELPAETVIAQIGSGPLTAQALGKLPSVNKKEMRKLVSATGKLTYAFAQ